MNDLEQQYMQLKAERAAIAIQIAEQATYSTGVDEALLERYRNITRASTAAFDRWIGA